MEIKFKNTYTIIEEKIHEGSFDADDFIEYLQDLDDLNIQDVLDHLIDYIDDYASDNDFYFYDELEDPDIEIESENIHIINKQEIIDYIKLKFADEY